MPRSIDVAAPRHDQEDSYWRSVRQVADLTDLQIASALNSSSESAPPSLISERALAVRQWARDQIRSKEEGLH